MLVNRHRKRREFGACQYCSDPRVQSLDPDGRCSVCQFTAKKFLSEVEGDTPELKKRGGRPIDMSPSVSVPKLLDSDVGLDRTRRLALLMDACCSPVVLRPDHAQLPAYSLRLRPLLTEWVEQNILNTGDEMGAHREYTLPPAAPPSGPWTSHDLLPWSTYNFTSTMDIYILSRIMSAHSSELRAYARQVVFHLHTRYGPRQEWDHALGIHPADPVDSQVFQWPVLLPPPIISDNDKELMRQATNTRAEIENRY